jgi:hypothetical protein
VYVVVLMGLTEAEPPGIAIASPASAGVIVNAIALFDVQVSVAVPPGLIAEGVAVSVTFGAPGTGGGERGRGAVGVTAALFLRGAVAAGATPCARAKDPQESNPNIATVNILVFNAVNASSSMRP